MVMHEFKQSDYAAKFHFCNWLIQNMHDGIMNLHTLFISNMAWSYVSHHANMENAEIWSNENHHIIQQVSLDNVKVEMLCAWSAYQITGSIFLQWTEQEQYNESLL
jgi:hypothetical protein